MSTYFDAGYGLVAAMDLEVNFPTSGSVVKDAITARESLAKTSLLVQCAYPLTLLR